MSVANHKQWIEITTVSQQINRDSAEESNADTFEFTNEETSKTSRSAKIPVLERPNNKHSADAASDVPVVDMSLNYEEVEWTYDEAVETPPVCFESIDIF